MSTPTRLPDAVLSGLDPASADADRIPALAAGFPGFAFGIAPIDDDYWRAGPIVDPEYRHYGEQELADPSSPRADHLPASDRLTGPVYRLLGRAGGAVIHVRSFLDRCGHTEREKREAKRPELLRFFRDWDESSARQLRVRALPRWADRSYGF